LCALTQEHFSSDTKETENIGHKYNSLNAALYIFDIGEEMFAVLL
jgi:hypothetical protein